MNANDDKQETLELLAELSLREKAELCTGRTFWHLHGVERLGLPSVMVTDGPHGLRKQAGDSDHIGLSESVPAVCFPSAAGLASTWNRELIGRIGVALGQECLQEKVSVLLGPGVNIKRSPLCGRNFEYFSEDPYLSGEMGTAWVNGVQSQGIGASLKHYAVNNQESHRLVVDAIVDERSLREIYLPAFERTVRQAQPWTVMCSYNLVNGTYLSEHRRLLTDILKGEWGHEGLVVTDWGAVTDRLEGLLAGLELDMPANEHLFTQQIVDAAQGSQEYRDALDAAATRVIRLILKSRPALGQDHSYDETAHHALARKAAEEACVLLKNEGDLLPLAKGSSLAAVGAMAMKPRYQGAGSSQITPTRIDIPFEELARLMPEEQAPAYAPGYRLSGDGVDTGLIDEAVKLASRADTVVLVAGLPETHESEGFDRKHMRLPDDQLALIDALLAVTDRLVLVLQNGSPVELPFLDRVPAILEAYLGGQAGGSAMARVILGDAVPGGKLAESFPLKMEDVPCHPWFPGEPRQVQYREGIWVGYRYYCSAGQPVAFPFGHGLSYTQFAYHDIRLGGSGLQQEAVNADQLGEWDGLLVECDIENTGERAGWEIGQLYIGGSNSVVHRPRRELIGFDKRWLEPGERATVQFSIGRRALAYWCIEADRWLVPAGNYELEVGASAEDIRLRRSLTVTSADTAPTPDPRLAPYFVPAVLDVPDEAFCALIDGELPSPPPVRPFNMNSTIEEVGTTMLGRLLSKQVKQSLLDMAGEDMDEKMEHMIEATVREMPLRCLITLSGGKVSSKTISVLIQLMNRRFGSALGLAFKRDYKHTL